MANRRWMRVTLAAGAGVVVAAAAVSQVHAAAATDLKQNVAAQLRIDGVNDGRPTPITSFTLGATDTLSVSSGAGGGAGKVTFSNLVIAKTLDGDSVPLLQAASTGQSLRSVSIDVFAGGGSTPFATYTFEDVLVTSTVFGTPASLVGEQDSFDFRRIVADVNINGQIFHSCFDVKALTACQ